MPLERNSHERILDNLRFITNINFIRRTFWTYTRMKIIDSLIISNFLHPTGPKTGIAYAKCYYDPPNLLVKLEVPV